MMVINMKETIGKRIARLRQQFGWTQQELAVRLSISRVAISHIEMDLSLPSERTLTLLAGIFKLAPHRLVEGSDYPAAKADRLPSVACTYTPLELDLALLDNDLEWLGRLKSISLEVADYRNWQRLTLSGWRKRLKVWQSDWLDNHDQHLLSNALKRLAELEKKG